MSSELEKKFGEQIAEGGYGHVYLGKDRVTKILERGTRPSAAEIDILFRLRSPHLLRGLAILEPHECGRRSGPGIQTEICIKKGFKIESDEAGLRQMMFDYAAGVKYLHDHGYCHFDIGHNNCMVTGQVDSNNSDGKYHQIDGKLIDFGLAVAMQKDAKGQLIPRNFNDARTTSYYRPLEMLRGDETLGPTVDVWALGLYFLELLSDEMIGDLDDEKKQIYRVRNRDGERVLDEDATILKQHEENKPWERKTIKAWIAPYLEHMITLSVAPEIRKSKALYNAFVSSKVDLATDLIAGMLNPRVAERLTIDQVIQHKYFDELVLPPYQAPVEAQGVEFRCTREHYHGLTTLIRTVRHEYGTCDVEMLFNAIDIYLRAIPHFPNGPYDKLAEGAVLIAADLHFYSQDDDPDDSEGRPYSVKIIKALGGILRRRVVLEACPSLESLVYLLRRAFMSSDFALIGRYGVLRTSDFAALLPTAPAAAVTTASGSGGATPLNVFFTHVDRTHLISISREAVEAAFGYLGELLTSVFTDYQKEFKLLAVDVWFQLLDVARNDMTLLGLSSAPTVDQLKTMTLACVFCAHTRIYTKRELPKSYTKTDLPTVWSLAANIPNFLSTHHRYRNKYYELARKDKPLLEILTTKLLTDRVGAASSSSAATTSTSVAASAGGSSTSASGAYLGLTLYHTYFYRDALDAIRSHYKLH